MPNVFDQFDQLAAPGGNSFDRFDAPAQPEPGQISAFGYTPSLTGMAKGLFNAAAGAVTAPGDVFLGRAPTPYETGTPNPDLTTRAANFAMLFSPASAALRAGEVIPGELATKAVPSAQQLKNAASAGYDAARASTATVPGEAVAEMAQQAQQSLMGEHGIIPKTAPKTYAILDELANPPAGGAGNYSGLEAARRGLSTIASEGGTEGFAAQKAIPQLDKFIDALSPEAADARANYAAAMRSNSLTGELDKANTGIVEQAQARAHASHSGTNLDNSIRQRVASFLQNPSNLSGFSPTEIDALRSVVEGGPARNSARYIGNYFGGGGGLGQWAATLGGAALGEHLMPGFEGAAIGAGLPLAVGTSAKAIENSLAQRALSGVDAMVRARSPLGDAFQAQGLLTPSMTHNEAVLRALMPGLLGSFGAPVPQGNSMLPNGPKPIPISLLDGWA